MHRACCWALHTAQAWERAFWGLRYREDSQGLSLFLCGGSHDEVTLPKVREALMNIDPSLDKQTLNSYLSQAFQLPMTELPEEGEEKEGGIVIRLQAALEQLQWGPESRNLQAEATEGSLSAPVLLTSDCCYKIVCLNPCYSLGYAGESREGWLVPAWLVPEHAPKHSIFCL